ncbi:hypothetical protein SEPCBS119000_001715 [Sporothrix epigloea]|uniref:Phosphotransferase n=1 Tax=Sporothrix epigloea TaxID=1892477 RepID=A0ABP0DC71_9PEZI
MGDVPEASMGLDRFLERMRIDDERVYTLSREFSSTFTRLAAESTDQFLPTPITESIIRPLREKKLQGRFLAIDIGGTNLRAGFIELLGNHEPLMNESARASSQQSTPNLCRLHEHSWPIQAHLKTGDVDGLFAWIGSCIAEVVREGCVSFGLPRATPLPMGVTFSFPMQQESLSEARLMSMGKGFAISSYLELGPHLVAGYEKARAASTDFVLPPVKIAAIANDAVSTLVSFLYEAPRCANSKAAMGVICGTGSNATLLLEQSKLHPSKRRDYGHDVKIAVNTEWSIRGSAAAIRAVQFIHPWDEQLSDSVECPGFQPLEYMTAGRYLGELGRIMLVDYMTTVLGVVRETIPKKLLRKFEPNSTTFLSHYRPGRGQSLLAMLEAEYPVDDRESNDGIANGSAAGTADERTSGEHPKYGASLAPFRWTDETATALYHIAKAIETRAAAIIAAAIIGLLDCATELPLPAQHASAHVCTPASRPVDQLELLVGYTGGCITNFQDYLADCQTYLDKLVARRYGSLTAAPIRVVLRPCHDGGIKGAGILVPASLASQSIL